MSHAAPAQRRQRDPHGRCDRGLKRDRQPVRDEAGRLVCTACGEAV